MLRRLGIRGKVLAALSVPVLVLFVLAGTIGVQSLEDARTARTMTDLLGALDRARDLSVSLQDERDAALRVVTAEPEDRADATAELGTIRAATNDRITRSQREAAQIDLGPLTERAVGGLRDQLSELDTVRRAVDSGQLSMRATFNAYSVIIDRVVNFPQVVANAIDDRELAGIIVAQTEVVRLREGYTQEQVLGREVLGGVAQTGPDVQALSSLFPATNIQQESATLTVRQLELGGEVDVPPLVTGLQTFGNFRSLATSGQTYMGFLDPVQWYESAELQIDSYDGVLSDLRSAAQSRAQTSADAAQFAAILTIALTVLAVVVSIAAALLIARQIVNPLRRLTAAAGEVREELPRLVDQVAVPGQTPDVSLAQIPVDTRDEIGQLATAFNDVNATTIQVAQEQAALRGSIAEMFVNVARRDQVLLNRQLSFIDALERSEEDPKTLADLFRLDHLATRMRRNAESLLVLAGIDTGRRLRETLPTSDVIRTASSEIEHYERVQLDLPIDPMMLGHTALPAAHLLAELLENATVFSDPGTPVLVSTGVDEHHVIITVLDQGLGMTAQEIEEANAKIRTTSASDVLGAQRLGLFVVGRIANRLGAIVELGRGPSGTGTLATVRLPLVLFVNPEALPLTAPTQAAPIERFAPTEPAPEDLSHLAVGVQDVAPGSLGSAENPAAEVDLGALTDGTTGHGLPRRRSRGADAQAPAPSARYREQDDAAAASSIPLAPKADALAGAAGFADEEVWTPPVIDASTPLVARRRTSGGEDAAPGLPGREPTPGPGAAAEPPALPTRGAPAGGLPVRQPAAETSGLPVRRPAGETSGLPSRQPAETGGLPVRQPAGDAPGLPVRQPADGGAGLPTRRPAQAPGAFPAQPAGGFPAGPSVGDQARPDSRAAMFTGFRSRRAELAAAAVSDTAHRPEPEGTAEPADGAERLAAAAAFFGRRGGDAPGEQQHPAEVEVDGYDAPARGTEPDGTRRRDARHVAAPDHGSAADEDQGLGFTVPALVDDDEEFGAAPSLPADVAPVGPAWATATEQPEVPRPGAPEPSMGRHGIAPAEPAWEPRQAWQEDEHAGSQAEPQAVVQQDTHEQYGQEQYGQEQYGQEQYGQEQYAQEQYGQDSGYAEEAEPAAEDRYAVPQTWADQPTEQWDRPAGEQWLSDPPRPAPEPEPEPEPAPAPPLPAGTWSRPPAWSPDGAPPPPLQQAPSAAPAASPASGEFAAPVWSAPAPGSGGSPFAPVHDGPTRREVREPKRRRGLFGRRKSKQGAAEDRGSQPVPTGLPPIAQAEQAAPEQLPPPVTGFGAPPMAAAPQRQSAWGGAEQGADQGERQVPTTSAPAAPPMPRREPSRPVAFAPEPQQAPPAERPDPATSAAVPAAFFSGGGRRGQADQNGNQHVPAGPRPDAAAAPVQTGGWTPPPSPAAEVPRPASGPRAFTPQAFEPPASGGFDEDPANLLAQRADIAQQALAELSQLSAYRPKAVSAESSTTLQRRTPGTIPAAPAIERRPGGARTDRDANQVRSLLSSFQSGTSRGRQAADSSQSTGTGPGRADHDALGNGRGEPVTTPEADLTPRGTSW